MVLLASDFDKSKYLKAADLSGEKKFRIKSVSVEEIGTEKKERKPILWFTNDERGLVLNKTNNRTTRGVFGDNMEAWAGKIIAVFPTMVPMGGKMVPALRVRVPPPKEGNGQATARPAPQTPPQPAPQPPLTVDNDMDDEIPW